MNPFVKKSPTPRLPRHSPAVELRRFGSLVLSTLWLLAACSKAPDTSSTHIPTSVAPAYAAVARGRVDIEGGLLSLSMPRDGVLSKVAVHEGDRVHKGQLLAALNSEPAKLAIGAAQANVARAEAQLKLLSIKQAAAKQRAARLSAALAAGAGDGQSADDAREAAAQLVAEQAVARAALAMSREKLDEARYELKQRSLFAPFDADVVKMSAQPGASVSPSSGPLFTLLPEKPRIVRAELNESFVGVIKPGMHAEVYANSNPTTQHWSAHVLRIAQVYGPATLENDPQIRANARTVECVLAFDKPQNLRIGQRVTVRFATRYTPKD